MADIDIVAHLYPDVRIAPSDPSAIAIDLSGNKERRVAPRREPPHLVAAQPLTSYSRQDREPTEDPKQNDSLDYTACLKIDLSQIPKTSLGLVAGWDPKADIILPRVLGVSFHHFSLTFNDSYCLVVRDLGSRAGTSVIYDCADGGPRSNFQWIIGGDENLQGHSPITIKVVPDLQFRIVVDAYDTSLEAFRNKVDIFRAGTAGLEDTFGDIDIRPSTQLPTGIHTPAGDDFFLQKKLGEGAFAVVYHAWNVRTGAVHALKKPLGEVRNRHVKAWKNEALLMGRVSHVSFYHCPILSSPLYSDIPSRTTSLSSSGLRPGLRHHCALNISQVDHLGSICRTASTFLSSSVSRLRGRLCQHWYISTSSTHQSHTETSAMQIFS